jgi:hypothetical protein
MTTHDIVEVLAEECQDDHVGLWRIVDAVRLDLGLTDPDQIRSATLGLVRSLLDEPGIRAGHPTPKGRQFTTWKLTPQQVIGRIEEEWSALGRDPDIGEITWFTSVAEPDDPG